MATLTATTSVVCRSQAVGRPVPHFRQAHARMPLSAKTCTLGGSASKEKNFLLFQEPPWQRQEGTGAGGSTDSEKSKSEPELTPQDKKGRRTAIITGFISIGFGVAYLLLVSLLDSRGSVLHPPPPEAYGL